eukprot:Opistho-2@23601
MSPDNDTWAVHCPNTQVDKSSERTPETTNAKKIDAAQDDGAYIHRQSAAMQVTDIVQETQRKAKAGHAHAHALTHRNASLSLEGMQLVTANGPQCADEYTI